MEKKDLKSMTLEELTEFVKELGEKPFRAKQLYQWMHVKLAESLDECTNLPKSLKEKLSEYRKDAGIGDRRDKKVSVRSR